MELMAKNLVFLLLFGLIPNIETVTELGCLHLSYAEIKLLSLPRRIEVQQNVKFNTHRDKNSDI